MTASMWLRWARRHSGAAMVLIAAGARIWTANGYTDMRTGMNGLELLVQEGLRRNPFAGEVFVSAVALPGLREVQPSSGAIPRDREGWAGPNLLAMMLFEKLGQHQPLNRQAERYAKEGVRTSLSAMACQVGGADAVAHAPQGACRAMAWRRHQGAGSGQG
jgi:transposase